MRATSEERAREAEPAAAAAGERGAATARLRARRFADAVVVAAFLAAVLVPGVGLLAVGETTTVSEIERRPLARRPEWSWSVSAAAEWPARARRWLEDHFVLRATLVRWHAALLWHALGTSASSEAFAGQDGWLFYAADGGLEDWTQATPFGEPELERWRELLERFHGWLAARGVRFLVVLAPDKQMIYPERMPRSLRRLRPEFRADRLLAHLRERSTVEVLDLRPALMAAKPRTLLYHRYDTHWNDRGALVAAAAVASRLRDWFPEVEPPGEADFEPVRGVPSGDPTTLLALRDPGKEAMAGLVPRGGRRHRTVEPARPDPWGEDGRVVTEVPGARLPSAVVFRDSFGSRLIPFLAERFRRAVWLWQSHPDLALVERERPDVVVLEIVGRHLVTLAPAPEGIPR